MGDLSLLALWGKIKLANIWYLFGSCYFMGPSVIVVTARRGKKSTFELSWCVGGNFVQLSVPIIRFLGAQIYCVFNESKTGRIQSRLQWTYLWEKLLFLDSVLASNMAAACCLGLGVRKLHSGKASRCARKTEAWFFSKVEIFQCFCHILVFPHTPAWKKATQTFIDFF